MKDASGNERMGIEVWIGRTAVGAMEDIYERDARIELQRLGKLAKDRGLRIAELEKEIERDHIRFRNATEDLIRERDEAVGLLKHLTRRSLIRKDVEVLATLGDENAKRILELIGEGE